MTTLDNENALNALNQEAKDLGIEEITETKETSPEAEPAKEPAKESTPPNKIEDEDEEVLDKTKPLPPKYVPVDKYQTQKKKWKSEIDEERTKREEVETQLAEKVSLYEKMEAKLAELSKSKDDEKTKDELEADINALAEKTGDDPEHIKAIVALARKGLDVTKPEVAPEAKPEAKPVDKVQEQAFFEKEWTDLVATDAFKTQYPDLTPDQLAKAKTVMQGIAYTPQTIGLDLDYLLFKNTDSFKDILVSPHKKGLESGKLSKGDDAKPEIKLDRDSSLADINAVENELLNAVEEQKNRKIMRNGEEITI